jgi:hypothetical protein
MNSQSGNLALDLNQGKFSITDGTTNRIQLGLLDDGTTGMVIKDQSGNILLQISGPTNLIQGSDGKMVLDFTNTQLIIKDAGGTPVILLGKQTGGF